MFPSAARITPATIRRQSYRFPGNPSRLGGVRNEAGERRCGSVMLWSTSAARATARERETYHVYRVHEEPAEYQVSQQIPEYESKTKRRHAPPAETSVLVGWCKDEDHLKWILKSKLYNFRMNTAPGSLRLKPEITGAKYLLLHGEGGGALPGLFRIISDGPRVISKDALLKKGYPNEPRHDHYLISDVEPAAEFQDFEWDYKKLASRQEGRKSAWPYHVSLAELMTVRREDN